MDPIGIPTNLQALIDKLKSLKWTGNDGPNPHHWDAESVHCDAGTEAPDRLWVRFKFTDGGAPHEIRASMPWNQPGTHGGDDQITLDGQPTTGDDFVIGHRWGWFGFRIIVEYHFTDAAGTKHDYRFDSQ